MMPVIKQNDSPREAIAPERERYISHTNNLMMVVIDFNDGPNDEPDEPHHHPHEQITYVAEGELLFFLNGIPHHLSSGDMITVPSNVPHMVQPLTEKVRLVDTFNPIREEFLQSE